jgi:hypothetical protein
MWHVMELGEKEAMMAVIDRHGGTFSVDLCKALRRECSIPFKDMHSMPTCYHLAKQFPIHLTMMALTTNNTQQTESDEIAMTKAADLGATSSNPMVSVVLNLFDHMVQKRLFDPKVMEHHPSSYLTIEFSKDQMEELGAGAKDLTKQRIMSFGGGYGATMKLAKRKLDNLEYIKAFSGVQNDPDRLCRLTNKLELVQSLASITDAEAEDAAAQKAAGEAETQLPASASKNKLIEKDLDPNKLTQREIIAVLAVYYRKQESEKKNKPSLVSLLKAAIELNESALHIN